MFFSETVARAIHADRVRDLERAARERRLLAANEDETVARVPATPVAALPATKRSGCGDSAGVPA